MSGINKKCFIFLVIFQLPFYSFSQGEFNQWRFGYNAGLDFNQTPPIAVSGSALVSLFITVSSADSNGTLLFYSNGTNVWNRNNTIMSNGSGLFTNFACQTVFSAPIPGTLHLYYLFTIGPWNFLPTMKGLFYSIIDMQLNAGLGGIVSGEKNIPVMGGENVPTGIHGTRHWNNKDTWIVVRSQEPQQYLSYLIIPMLNGFSIESTMGC